MNLKRSINVSADNRLRQHPVLQRIIEVDQPVRLRTAAAKAYPPRHGRLPVRVNQQRLHLTPVMQLQAWSNVTQPMRQRASFVAPLEIRIAASTG